MSLHKSHSLANIPFSWENQPGISKVTPHAGESPCHEEQPLKLKLTPPPCQSDSPKAVPHGIFVPLPPCAFQPPPQKVPAKKLSKKEGEDPFLAAYMECTKSRKQRKTAKERRRDVWAVLERLGLGLSCRSSCGIREGVMVSLSKLPEDRERESK